MLLIWILSCLPTLIGILSCLPTLIWILSCLPTLTDAYLDSELLTDAYRDSDLLLTFSTAICISRKGSIIQQIILLNPLSAAGSVARIRCPISPNGLLDLSLVLPSVLMSHYRAFVIRDTIYYPLLRLFRLLFLYRTSNYARSSKFLPGAGFGTTGLPFLSYMFTILLCVPVRSV
jgi:hypothetical protein